MLMTHLMLEDTVVTAELIYTSTPSIEVDGDSLDSQYWDIRVTDLLSGKRGQTTCTPEEYRAVMLIVMNEDEPCDQLKAWYDRAEPVMSRLPLECRFIS